MSTFLDAYSLPCKYFSSIDGACSFYSTLMKQQTATKDQDYPALVMDIDISSNGPTIGIIGGMGPLATLYLLKKIKSLPAVRRIVCLMLTFVPDRTTAYLEEKTGTLHNEIKQIFSEASTFLNTFSVDHIVMPCNTAHAFSSTIKGPFRHMPKLMAKKLLRSGIRRIVSLATQGTNQSNYYPKVFNAVTNNSIDVLIPNKCEQALISRIIYTHIKASGKINNDAISDYITLIRQMVEHYKEDTHIYIGWFCTELPLVGNDQRTHEQLIQQSIVSDNGPIPIASRITCFDPMDALIEHLSLPI